MVLLVVVTAAVLFVRSRDEGLANSFASNDVVPFSFSYPDGWQREEQGNLVMFSPHARELLPLFASLGADGWAETSALVERSPSEVVGLFTWFDTTRYDGATVDQIQENLRHLLPQEVEFSPAREEAVVGGFTADRLEGELREPGARPESCASSATWCTSSRRRPSPSTSCSSSRARPSTATGAVRAHHRVGGF